MGAEPPQPPQPTPGHSGGAPAGRWRFATTQWSVVLAAGKGGADTPAGAAPSAGEARDALSLLCRTYWYPLYAYVRARGHGADEAQDLTQSFFARLLEKNTLRAADPERGRFRSFLLASLKHFLANEWDRQSAQKRGGGRPVASLDVAYDDAERRYAREPADTLTPERLFERGWAVTLLDTVLEDLRSRYAAEGKGELFARLKPYLAGDATAPPYAQTAADAGMSEGAVQVVVHRMRKRYRELLREHIEQTVESPEQAEEEIRDLFRAVRGQA